MSRFLIGLLLGALLGIGGTAAFLIAYGGGDYLVSTSPRVRELEAQLRDAEVERDWLKGQLREATDLVQRLESRFDGLAVRFERLARQASSSEGQSSRGASDRPSTPAPAEPTPAASATPAPSMSPSPAPIESGEGLGGAAAEPEPSASAGA